MRANSSSASSFIHSNGDLSKIRTRPLFDIRLHVPEVLDLGDTPLGRRRIAHVAGGEFHGERLRGAVVAAPAGDWLLQRSDGVTVLDVRLLLRTDDGEPIYMTYRGLRHGPADVMARLAAGEPVDPDRYYFRIAPVFETSAPQYEWINRLVAIGPGPLTIALPSWCTWSISLVAVGSS